MHKSRLAGIIIDCRTDDLAGAADFWSKALGAPVKPDTYPEPGPYIELEMPDGDPYLEVQRVDHESRVHIDIEADDIDAEVRRLKKLGAKELDRIRSWVVMEAPTGQRFCVVKVIRSGFGDNANEWT